VKKLILALSMLLPQISSAEQQSMDMLNQLHDGVCKDHQNLSFAKGLLGPS